VSPIPGLDWHAIAILAGMVMVFVVMARDRLPITVVSLCIIASLAIGIQLFPYEGLAPSDFLSLLSLFRNRTLRGSGR
jgi:hypothetical protein